MLKQALRSMFLAGIKAAMPPDLQRRLAVTNRLALTIALGAAPYIAVFMANGSFLLALLTVSVVGGHLCVLALNASGLQRMSRQTLLLVGNGAVWLYAMALGLGAGVHVFFLANLCYPFVAFTASERRTQWFGVALPAALSTAVFLNEGLPWVVLPPEILHWVAIATDCSAFLALGAAFSYLAQSNDRSKAVLRREVEERTQAEGKLATSEARLRSLFECADDVIFTIGLDLRYLDVSPSVERYGVKRAAMVGRRVSELLDADTAAAYALAHQEVIATKGAQRVLRLVKWGGNEASWFSTSYSAVLDTEGAVVAVVGIARNVTADQNHEADLERAKNAAEAANRSKSSFLATMNHEIRTPISAVLGFAELLAEASISDEQRVQATAAIQRNGRHLMTLIDTILDLSCLEAQQLKIDHQPIFLVAEVDEVVEQLKSLGHRKQLQLNLRVAGDVPQVISIDVTRLRQILVNLIANALKFTVEGHVTVTIARAEAVNLGDAGKIAIVVEDTGCGIKASEQDRLFQPFSQLDSLLARPQSGVGLGLFLIKQLARALQGDVVLVKSVLGQGSIFALLVDAGTAHTQAEGRALLQKNMALKLLNKPTEVGQGLLGARLLLVDDNDDNRELFSILLAAEGAVVTAAKDGFEGLTRAREAKFDVILLDLQMPGLDGYLMAEELQKEGCSTPLIAFTAHATSKELDRCLKAGFTGFLTKPVTKHSLTAEVQKILAAKKRW